MTRPIYEPSLQRTDRRLGYTSDQLLRRPAPTSEAAESIAMWPMSYDVIPFDVFQYGPDKESGSSWTTFPTFDSNYMRGYYVEKNSSTGQFLRYFRLGPKGSIWSLSFITDLGSDCGKIKFSWQTISEDAPGRGYLLDGLGMIAGSTDRSTPTYYTAGTSTFDCYSAAPSLHDARTGFSQFRIMGDPGDPITSNGTSAGPDGEEHFDGGPGIWVLKVENITKNASSSANRIRFEDFWVRRNVSDGFPA